MSNTNPVIERYKKKLCYTFILTEGQWQRRIACQKCGFLTDSIKIIWTHICIDRRIQEIIQARGT